jgi:serine/threonine protein kinase
VKVLLTLVTEYISKGNLDDILDTGDTAIPLDIRLGIAVGYAEALSYMHSMHLSSDSLICHGDIKEPFGSPGMTRWKDSRPELLSNLYKLQLSGRIPGLVLI